MGAALGATAPHGASLFFTAGLNDEADGLFGTLAVPEPAAPMLLGIGLAALAVMRRRTLARDSA